MDQVRAYFLTNEKLKIYASVHIKSNDEPIRLSHYLLFPG